MAHRQQKEFFKELATRFSDRFNSISRVLEVGSQNINGSVRQYFPNATEYLGIDLGLAPDVDWAIPGELVELPNGWAEVVISTECFEHCESWEKVFINMIRIAAPRSLIIITCASPGRPTHGTIDSEMDSSPFTPSYYKNLGTDEICQKIALGHYFTSHSFEINSLSSDLYFWGIRSDLNIHESDQYWEDPMSRLARAQGQLGQAAARHSAIQKEVTDIKEQAVQLRAEADQARAEADQARTEANQARAEADQAKAQTEMLVSQMKMIEDSTFWKTTRTCRESINTLKRVFRLPRQ